jgi:hypothetical protein
MYWSTVISSKMHGTELSCLSEDAIDLLELGHRNFGRHTPTIASNPASYVLLGWKSLQAYRYIVTLCYEILTIIYLRN